MVKKGKTVKVRDGTKMSKSIVWVIKIPLKALILIRDQNV